MSTVVIVGSAKDAQCQYVSAAIEKQGGDVLLLETARVPEQVSLTWEQGDVVYEGQSLSDCRSFYLKAMHISIPSHDPGQFSLRNFDIWQEQYVAERERHSFLASILRHLNEEGRSFVNPVETFDMHFLKLYQMSLLERRGVNVPASLATSDPTALTSFVEKHGSVIYKPLAGGALVKRVHERDLTPERLMLVKNAPVLFQQEILGEEFRAYVLNGEPVAVVQIPTEGLVDARVALDKAALATIPDEAWKQAALAAETIGVVFGAVDMRRTEQGEWFVLECNPTPAISFFDTEDGLIVNRLAQYLLEQA